MSMAKLISMMRGVLENLPEYSYFNFLEFGEQSMNKYYKRIVPKNIGNIEFTLY